MTHLPGGSDPLETGGIKFDTYPQAGDWLYIETTGAGGPNSLGVDFEVAGGSFNVNINDNNNLGFFSRGGGRIDVQTVAGGNIFISSAGGVGGLELSNTSSGGLLINDQSSGGLGIQEEGSGGIFIEDDGGGGILVAATSGGGLKIQNNQSAASDTSELQILDYGDGGINISTITSGGGGDGDITINAAGTGSVIAKSSPSSGDHPRMELFSPSVGGSDEFFFGNDGPAIVHSGPLDQLKIFGGSTSDNVTVWTNITLNAFQGSDGTSAAHAEYTTVEVTPSLMLAGISPEANGSVAGSYACMLYSYNDGTGHPKLKAYFPGTGTRVLLATG